MCPLKKKNSKFSRNEIEHSNSKKYSELIKKNLAIKQINLCLEIEDDYTWAYYIYSLIFLKISKLNQPNEVKKRQEKIKERIKSFEETNSKTSLLSKDKKGELKTEQSSKSTLRSKKKSTSRSKKKSISNSEENNTIQNSDLVSLKELNIILTTIEIFISSESSIQPSLDSTSEKEKSTEEYLFLNKKNCITEVKDSQSSFCFHSKINNLETIKTRQEIFHNIKKNLIQDLQTLQYINFRKIITESLTSIVQEIIKKRHKDILIASQFFNMLAYFNALRGFPLIVNCFPNLSYQSYYSEFIYADFTYAAEKISQKQKDKKRKNILKYGIIGYEADTDKSFISGPANFIQANDGELLRKVVSKFLKKFPGKGFWIRHDCFVVSPEYFSALQKLYKEAFIETFFTNSETFTYKDKKIVLAEKSPIYIFKILLISNLFNLLDYSLKSKGYILESSNILDSISKNKKVLRNKNDLVKDLILDFVQKPNLDILYEITTSFPLLVKQYLLFKTKMQWIKQLNSKQHS